MLGTVKLDNTLLTCGQGNFNQIATRSRNRTLVTVVRDLCTTTVPPASPGVFFHLMRLAYSQWLTRCLTRTWPAPDHATVYNPQFMVKNRTKINSVKEKSVSEKPSLLFLDPKADKINLTDRWLMTREATDNTKLHGSSKLLANASWVFLPWVTVTKRSPTGKFFRLLDFLTLWI